MRYTICAKCFDELKLIGFRVVDDDSNSRILKYDDVVKLARGDKIENAGYYYDTTIGSYILDIFDGLESLDTEFKNSDVELTLKCRIIDSKSKKCIGYKADDKSGKSYKLSIGKTWELAYNHRIIGVEAKIIGNSKVLKSSTENMLEQLPKLDT